MKKILPYCLLILTGGMTIPSLMAQETLNVSMETVEIVSDSLIVSDPVALFESIPQPEINPRVLNLSLSPKVFSGYQKIMDIPDLSEKPLVYNLSVMTPSEDIEITEVSDEASQMLAATESNPTSEYIADAATDASLRKYQTPQWLKEQLGQAMAQENLLYTYMIENPMAIEYAYWDLPLPPELLEEDTSFLAFLNRQEVPEVKPEEAAIEEVEIKKKHWLHNLGAQLQFSQAYVSPNWYQGGNNYLSLLFGFNWKVNLNQVYHPRYLFQSDLQYKLAVTSNPKGYYHKYTIAEDNFQYNLNLGLKAVKEWFYSFNLQFKTQLFNNFEQDSDVRTASFLSPGDLNLGLGMSYTHTNKLNTFNYTITISPLSYNLKTCISDKVDHETYSIPQYKKSKSEIGSNLDFTMNWNITANISYKTRVFMFTNYKYYLCDWQNTFNFDINKFLSTQLFVHLRYDGSTESSTKWKKFMMREILSFGLSYTFSTKP